jgi:membrane-bound serine protease (ClpP class)
MIRVFDVWKRPAVLAGTVALVLAAGAFRASVRAEESGGNVVEELAIDREIEPVLATYIDEGIADAEKRNASLIVITMDTPGGLSDSMKNIVQHILSSKIPVVVYVSPTGARGASAGFFILLSADVAAMAPGTHAGAASPVLAIGGWTVTVDETMKKKIFNDTEAFLRSITEKRGRNPALAETAVTEAKAFTEKEALDGKLIDLIAANQDDLLKQLNGRTVTRFDGTRTQLDLAHPVRIAFELSARQRFLARIVEPDMFFVLLIVAALGLYTEFTHPGMIAPGVIGAVAAVLALYAMHLLPVNTAGLLLILVALALFVLEAKYTSHGVLAIGGVVSMLLGALFLIRSPLTAGGVSLGLAVAVTLPFALLTIFLMRLVLRSRTWKPAAGKEELIGKEGTALSAFKAGSEGMIRINSELWSAVSTQDVAEGKLVRVLRVEGLRLYVEPVNSPGGVG